MFAKDQFQRVDNRIAELTKLRLQSGELQAQMRAFDESTGAALFTETQFKLVETRISNLDQMLRKLRDLRAGMQDACQHDMRANGHDSHYNWEKCDICGYEERC